MLILACFLTKNERGDMAQHKSAIKRIKTSKQARSRNRQYKTKLKSTLKSVFGTEEKEILVEKARNAVSLLDKLATKGIIHRNKAANQKSRIAKYVNSL